MKKILIVEDDFIIQLFIKRVISSLNCKIVGTTNTSDNVLDLIAELKPDIVFMDISIEGKMNGIELAQKINETYKISVVYLTGNSDKSTMEKAKATNPLHIIIKPIDEISLAENFKILVEKYDLLRK